MSNTTRELKLIKVDVPKVLREKKTLPDNDFKKEVTLGKGVMRDKDWKIQMGRLGLMLESDFEQGLFSEYGLKEDRIMGKLKVKALEDANVDLQKRVAELEAELTKKAKKTTNE